MNEPALVIPYSALTTLTAGTRSELAALLGLPLEGASQAPAAATPRSPASENDGPADLTTAMARKLIAAPISPKSLAVLRVIAEGETPEFHLADAINAAPEATSYLDIRGAWSGITRRARKILGDAEADLIWWEGEGIYDDDDNYVDHLGRVSSLTHQSLRAAFGMRGGE